MKVALAALVLSSTIALADDVTGDLHCHFRHKVDEIDRLSAMPAPIVALVRAHMGSEAMAARGEAFNATDVVSAGDRLSSRRFIRAGHAGSTWFLWYEQGGYAYYKRIVAFTPGRTPRVLAAATYYRENPCVLTDAILDGHFEPPPGAPW